MLELVARLTTNIPLASHGSEFELMALRLLSATASHLDVALFLRARFPQLLPALHEAQEQSKLDDGGFIIDPHFIERRHLIRLLEHPLQALPSDPDGDTAGTPTNWMLGEGLAGEEAEAARWRYAPTAMTDDLLAKKYGGLWHETKPPLPTGGVVEPPPPSTDRLDGDGCGGGISVVASASEVDTELALCVDQLAPFLRNHGPGDSTGDIARATVGRTSVGGGACDWFAACMLVAVGDVSCAKKQLDALERSVTAPFVWYELGRRRAEAEGRVPAESYTLKMVAELDRVVQDELPQVTSALRTCGVPLASFVSRWLLQSYMGVLPIEQCSKRLALVLPYGAEYDVYFAASVLRHLSPALVALSARGDETALWSALRTRTVAGFACEEHEEWMGGLEKRHGSRIRSCLVAW